MGVLYVDPDSWPAEAQVEIAGAKVVRAPVITCFWCWERGPTQRVDLDGRAVHLCAACVQKTGKAAA